MLRWLVQPTQFPVVDRIGFRKRPYSLDGIDVFSLYSLVIWKWVEKGHWKGHNTLRGSGTLEKASREKFGPCIIHNSPVILVSRTYLQSLDA